MNHRIFSVHFRQPTIQRFRQVIGPLLWRMGCAISLLLLGGELHLVNRAKVLALTPVDAAPKGFQRLDPGQQFFLQGQYASALAWLQTELQRSRDQGDRLEEASILNNLALVYSELGQWNQAQAAIERSRSLLTLAIPEHQPVLAKVLNTYGQLQFHQGNAERALETWQRSSQFFQDLGEPTEAIKSQIREAQALQALGFYRRSILRLSDIGIELQQMPDSQDKVTSLRLLGEAMRVAGDLKQAKQMTYQGLLIAQALADPEAIAQSLLTLGQIATTAGLFEEALVHNQHAAQTTQLKTTRLTAQLNELNSYLELHAWPEAQQRWPVLLASLAAAPPTPSTTQGQLNLADSLQQLRQGTQSADILTEATLLAKAQRNAQILGDRRLESKALGKLGALYEQTGQYHDAKQLTQRALALIEPQRFADLAYLWHWQLGRIGKAQGNEVRAIEAYDVAIQLLAGLRQNLIATNLEIQFAFQESVEPLHREFVSLLLSGMSPSPEVLEQARQTIESLQLAELDNFFRSACLDITPVIVDQVDPAAAVVYPILLEERIAIVVRLPGQPLKLFTTEVSQNEVAKVVDRLQVTLGQSNTFQYLALSQQLYQWLLKEVMPDLLQSKIRTLVFIPDGVLRNIPMGVLHDGDRFLIEEFAISLTPGLQLLQSGEKKRDTPRVLVAGLTKARDVFGPLPHVKTEVDKITATLSHRSFLDEDFTKVSLEQAIQKRSFSVIHLATHGRFSSNISDTFLQTWDGKIDINQMRTILRDAELRHRASLELLVLSACETALGDRRAILGLAGIATRSGAKSTLATLWKVNDQATAELMAAFYQELGKGTLTKAEALQAAQKVILKHPTYGQHPYFWSGYILVGHWQ